MNPYESQEMLNKYLLMHWGSDEEIWGNAPKLNHKRPDVVHLPLKCAEIVKQYTIHFDRTLDLGCAVGRSTFELARDFKEVVGIDYSREFVDSANKLQKMGSENYWRKDSGADSITLTAKINPSINRNRVRFEQGDACGLPLHLKNFDAVLMANVLCRLPDPVACLERMQGGNALVKEGGILVMTTPFSWLEEYTPKSRWLDGIKDVQNILTEFELLHQEDLSFLIREHARKFEYIVTLASVWKRR